MSATMTPRYGAALGDALNAYVAQVVSRALAMPRGDVHAVTAYDRDAHAAASAALDELLAALWADSERLDALADWFSDGRDLVLQHDEPSDYLPLREREVTVYDKDGRNPWPLVVLLVRNAQPRESDDETLRDALDVVLGRRPA